MKWYLVIVSNALSSSRNEVRLVNNMLSVRMAWLQKTLDTDSLSRVPITRISLTCLPVASLLLVPLHVQILHGFMFIYLIVNGRTI